MLSSKRGHWENSRARIKLKQHAEPPCNHLSFPWFYFIFICISYRPVKQILKNSQKITEMGIVLEFVGNLRNFSQRMITGLMRSLDIHFYVYLKERVQRKKWNWKLKSYLCE